MLETETIEITVSQINAVMLHPRIRGVHSIFNNKLVVVCTDGYLRMIEFNKTRIIWLDKLNED